MTSRTEYESVKGTVSGIRNAVRLYVPTDYVEQPSFGFKPDDEYRGLILDGGAMLLWPSGDPPEFPQELSAPDPMALPWPTGSMGAPPPDWIYPDRESTDDVDESVDEEQTPDADQQVGDTTTPTR